MRGVYNLKIININALYGYRSTGVIVQDIHHYLLSNGVESYVGYSRGVGDSGTMRIGNAIDRKLHAFLSRTFGLQGYFSFVTTKRLVRKIDKINPDIIHLHNLHDNYINTHLLLEYIARKKKILILTLHDCWFFTGKCTHFTTDNCFKWSERCGDCPRLKKDNISWFFDRTSKMLVDKGNAYKKIENLGVIGVSNWITDIAQSSILRVAKKTKRIYNWVDILSYRKIDIEHNPLSSLYSGKRVILGVASFWNKPKGIDKFIELSNILKENYIIILIGNIGDEILPTNILNIKEIKNNADLMSQYYSLATVTVSFSLEESFGKTSIESLICGTPIIVQNSTASPELVGPNCGYVVNNQSVQDTLSYINKIIFSDKSSYSDDCIKFAKGLFDKEKILKEHLDFYKEMLEGN